jgi:hypothetical protein
MGWRYGAGGMLAALVLGAIGWPATAAAQFSLPPTFNNQQTRQLAPSTGITAPPAGAVTVPPSAGPAAGSFRSPPPMPGPGSAVGQVSLSLLARFGRDSGQITNGLVWRVFPARPDSGGVFRVLKEDRSPSPVVALPPGDYVVHVSFGMASMAKAVHLREASRETFELPAGGIKLEGRVGDVPIRGGQITFDIYKGSQFEPGDKGSPLVQGVATGDVVIVPEGAYHIVSNYGDTNAVVRSDIRVQAGKLTDVTVNHRAAVIMLKLVSEPGGDVIKESTGAFPRVVLAEGDYRAIARSDGRTYERNFKVITGVDGEVEVLAR